MLDAFKWAKEITVSLKDAFGERLVFTGLQGSCARGEANEGSDIDLVVILDGLSVDDLLRYKAIVNSMNGSELACGFIGSLDAIKAWPRHELFQFMNDTVGIYGDLRFAIDAFTRDEAIAAAKIGASGIYHGLCHGIVFDDMPKRDLLKALVKQSIFALQALTFIRTGKYISRKDELLGVVEADEIQLIEISLNNLLIDSMSDLQLKNLEGSLLKWSSAIIKDLR